MTGMVITLARLITAVSEIDSATSPRANAVRMLEVAPPGAAAMIIRPNASSGAIGQTLARTKATAGSRTIWERGAHREVARPAHHPGEIVEGEPEPESEHDEGERQWQHDIDEESHDAWPPVGCRLRPCAALRGRAKAVQRLFCVGDCIHYLDW